MTALTAEQIADFRQDIGDTNSAFSDAELQRLYVRSNESYNAAVLLAVDQLLANAAKFADYTQNDSDEKKSQVFANLMKLRSVWALRSSSDKAHVKIAGIRGVPAKNKDKPCR